MTKVQLTERQKAVYDLIQQLIQTRGYGPTVREIGEHFGIKSPNGVMCHLRALERKGMIDRKANKSRAIELTTEHARSATSLPLSGIISETPSPLDLNATESIDLGRSLALGPRIVLQVSGDHWSDRGIVDGDYVLIDTQRQPGTGDLTLLQVEQDRYVLASWSAGAATGRDASPGPETSRSDQGSSSAKPAGAKIPSGVATAVVRLGLTTD